MVLDLARFGLGPAGRSIVQVHARVSARAALAPLPFARAFGGALWRLVSEIPMPEMLLVQSG
jgi:hypothetical protein